MSRFLACGALGMMALAGQANASVITGVTATASSQLTTAPFNRAAAYTVNGAGLKPGNAFSNTPDGTMWLSNSSDPAPVITFNLGADYLLSSMQIWNYNEVNMTARGIRTASISTSIDGVTYAPPVNVTLRQAPGTTNTDFSQTVARSVSAEFIRFANLTSYGTDGYVGLSQVQFSGSPAPVTVGGGSAVPEPMSLALLGAACTTMMMARRRRPFIG